ncbi:uncharacterized protein SPSK_09857 [Sporothrix schenckii 1099-18]|uniref:Uncharacterized protein n=1 Tax=Sporothrix schenckii 1099-18 TaxID=1397361 RepID=A0A0F2MAB2_SPOSC|nr:uncharacterized protein SPSK_09857 [Sporothrix schenckii 1099-18]KJR85101.1 hypothetical protein SPSK_09857 [Sporothrix schenckii 1099-18]
MLCRLVTLGLATLLALLGPSPVAAAPKHYVFLDAPADNTYAWTVTSWVARYSEDDALCSYSRSPPRNHTTYGHRATADAEIPPDFNISGPFSGGQMPIPAFVAYCAGTGVGAPYALCHITDLRNTTKRRQVAAKLLPGNETTATEARLAVSYRFDDLNVADAWWNYTSYATQPYSNTVAGGGGAAVLTNGTTFTMTPSEVFGVA